ncbi:N-acetylmuramoyl-L-alanine amidase family protein [Clostridium sp. JN-9]|uniref:N-acetylmuramoyl-L-alanine amidase family protein n=1 Tax=Clostridium sp. JN-9 TaxID=2507159 RepID=UPI000FFE21EA|nr:N-acetylmuramoyl-L-alanine amidase family protein [Clostridium sp. JN-9]QAT40830.1 N-acetylmuramoyl-L-alanine amidase family protein [Clostridium sp. JN-9]
MEFWLINNDERLQLPVPPPNYSIKKSNDSSTVTVLGLGEISFIGTPKLAEIPAIESFFPNHPYSFCQYSTFPMPNKCVEMIEKWRNEGTVIRYLVTGTKLNMECTIESFEYGERDGTGDIYFSLQLKEYKRIANVAKEGWVYSGGIWYYFYGNGVRKTGWLLDSGKWYYLKENGAMATGWVMYGGVWYFLDPVKGEMAASKWILWNGKWYYLKSDGSMPVSTYINGWWVGSDGAWDGKPKVK